MHFLITAGGTREYIDPVRFISNASTGKMGYALAAAAAKLGHQVTLISAPVALKSPKTVSLIQVETSTQMFKAVKQHLAKCDCLIMAAAVSDYTPANPRKTKLTKSTKTSTLKLKPTPDILKWASAHKKKEQVIVGFALEDRNLRKNAEKKLREKNLDIIVANTPAAIAADKTTILIKVVGEDWRTFNNITKAAAAKKIVAKAQTCRQTKTTS
jgi:phosphopantothenoylcysteine decarboxylase/phosphopantothenate--cysteine ligase